jgi:hypothetical protein
LDVFCAVITTMLPQKKKIMNNEETKFVRQVAKVDPV